MDIDDILNESDESSTPEENEHSDSNQSQPPGRDQEDNTEEQKAPFELLDDDEVIAEFPDPLISPTNLDQKSSPDKIEKDAQNFDDMRRTNSNQYSDVASQEDDKVNERKQQMGLQRGGLKAVAATFVDQKPFKMSLIDSSPEKSQPSFNIHHDSNNQPQAQQKIKFESKTDDDLFESRPDRSAFSKANKIYQSFTAGLDRSSAKKLFSGSGDQGYRKRRDSNEKIDEEEKKRIMQIIEQEETSSEDDDSDEDSAMEETSQILGQKDGKQSNDDSFCSDNDILNRSLESSQSGEKACAPENILRYVSVKYNDSLDILGIVDKNERSFKQVAEKMIQQSSQLESQIDQNQPQRKLMHMQLFKKISDRFFGEDEVAQGVPYALAAVEDFIAIGSSDGSVHLFDHSEQEITVLQDKKVKASGVTCLDIKRIGPQKHIYVVAGHMKGQIVLYKIEGLFEQAVFIARQNTVNPFLSLQDNLFGNLRVKHCKTQSDKHDTTISCIKFVGDLTEQIQVVSGDVNGNVVMSEYKDTIIGHKVNTTVLMHQRLGATFSLAPLIQSKIQKRLDGNQAYLEVMQRLDGNVYKTETEKQVIAQQMAKRHNAQIIGFGSLDEVYVAQIQPRGLALLSIRRPPYIQPGTVPYLDWGNALTPQFRDKSYPVLAIAWGRTIQLAVYVNREEANQNQEEPRLELDGFYISEASSIDQCFFLSESLLFILVNKKEVRILYTQNFTPGVFSPTYLSKNARGRKAGADGNAEEEQEEILNFTRIKTQYAGDVSKYAEKDCGYRLMEDEIRHKDNNVMMNEHATRSKFNFTATVCKNDDFNIVALGKTAIGQRNLIHWEEYLDLIKLTNPDDWLKVLRASLDIYNGKIMGLAGLPDQKEKREIMLRERMKDLLKDNIDVCIREFQEGASVSQQTLRVAAEFCIRVGAIDHLFGELFQMFAEAGLEQKFLKNLDAFILSGKFKTTFIPEHILQRLIEYYRQTDVELLEKAILNLDLSTYPHAVQVRNICEEEYLSSALIHLLTSLFDDEQSNDTSVCISILCSLFNLMMRNQTMKTQAEILQLPKHILSQGISLFETQSFSPSKNKNTPSALDETEEQKQPDFMNNRKMKLDIEHSRTYIGYKLLWVTGLFIEGKKFPSGSLSIFKWRCFIYDIVRFLTSDRQVTFFLEFDPHCFLNIVAKLFLEQDPFEYIKSQHSFIEMYKDEIVGLEPCMTHEEIIACLDANVKSLLKQDKESNKGAQSSCKGEALQNAFLFFVTTVSRKSRVPIPQELCHRIVAEQILFYRKLVKLPRDVVKRVIPDTLEARKVRDRTHNIYIYLIQKNESELLGLVQRNVASFSTEQLSHLAELAEQAPLFRLRVLLQQLLGNFQKCLTMFFQIKAIRFEVFDWLKQVQESFSKSKNSDAQAATPETNQEFSFNISRQDQTKEVFMDKMKETIFEHIPAFVEMSSEQTIKICQQWFDSDYSSVAKVLVPQKELAFQFMSSVVSQNEEEIIQECENGGSMTGYKPSKVFNDLLLQLVEILCHRKYRHQIVEFVSRSYFPIQESLKICLEKNAREASAVLYRRNSEHYKAIELYTEVLVEIGIDLVPTLFDEIYQDMDCKNESIQKFDEVLAQIVKICDKQSSRMTTNQDQADLWKHALKSIFLIKQKVHLSMQSSSHNGSMDESSDSGMMERENFKRFLNSRHQRFIQQMSEYINLNKIVSFLEDEGHYMEFKQFKQTFKDKVRGESYTEAILLTAKRLNTRDILFESQQLEGYQAQGVVNKANRCDGCDLKFKFRQNKQEVWLFKCDHVFHTSCVQQSNGQCSVCFNELEAFCKYPHKNSRCFVSKLAVFIYSESILSTKKQSMAVKRAQRRQEQQVVKQNSTDMERQQNAKLISFTEHDEFEKHRLELESQLRQSKEFAESQGRTFESKKERYYKMLTLFEKTQSKEKLELSSFWE